MADPFSVTGSAVGVISLGLQVCSQIVSYSQALRSRDQDIQAIVNKADGLRTPLKRLRDLVEETQATDPDVAQDLGVKAMSLQNGIEKLRDTINEFKPPPSGKLNDRIGAVFKKAAYPFRKDILDSMEKELDDIRGNINTMLLVYSTSHSRLIPELVQEIRAMHLTLRDLPTRIPPATLRSWCDEHEAQTRLVKSNPPAQGHSGQSSCNEISTPPIWQFPQTKLPRKLSPSTKNKATRRYVYHSRILGFAISASFSVTTGAGGFSLAPVLRFLPIMRQNKLVHKTLWRDFSAKRSLSTQRWAEDVISTLQHHLENNDITMLDLAHKKNIEDALFSYSQLLDWERYPEGLMRVVQFLMSCGATLGAESGRSALDNYFYFYSPFGEAYDWLLSSLIDQGGNLTVSGDIHFSIRRMTIQWVLARNEEAVSASDIAKIILRDDETGLIAAIQSQEISPNDVVDTHLLLDLAIGWPRGVQILLDAGADPNRHRGWSSLLEKAVTEGCRHSAKLLLEAGARPTIPTLQTAIIQGKLELFSLLIAHLASQRKQLQNLARAHLPRCKLPDYAVTEDNTVPDTVAAYLYNELKACGAPIDPGLVVEYVGRSIYHEFFETGYYTTWRDISAVLDEMYRVGFHDVDVADLTGHTPLMIFIPTRTGFIEKAAWLVSKGANQYRALPESGATVTHLLAAGFSRFSSSTTWGFDLHWATRKGFDSIAPFLSDILHAPSEDQCHCACSISGCRPISMALYCLLNHRNIHPIAVKMELEFILTFTTPSLDLDKTIVRLMTFDGLGLTHTCCHKIEQGFAKVIDIIDRDTAEVEEIQEEAKDLIADLENLVAEFETKLEQLGLSIMEFLQGYWHTRIMEYLSHYDSYDEKHVTEARKLGVRLRLAEDLGPLRPSLTLGSVVQEIEDAESD